MAAAAAAAAPGAILFFLLFAGLAADAKTCPPCGTTAVPYPLSTASGCGQPDYPLRCASGTLFLDALNGTSYTVTSISSSTQRLIIATAPLTPPGSCLSGNLYNAGGVALNASLAYNVTASNTIMLLNCTSSILVAPLNCSSNSLCHVYADASGSAAAACAPLPICCTYVAGGSSTAHRIQITPQYCSAYQSFVGLDPTQPPTTWGAKAGMELQWVSPREPTCQTQADCEDAANTNCLVDTQPTADGSTGVKRCFCINGLVWDPFTGVCAQNPANCSDGGDCSGHNYAPLIAGLVSGVGAALVVAAAGIFVYRRQRRIRLAREELLRQREEILNMHNTSGRSAKYFSDRELKKATSNFSADNLLGIGGYGEVYKGVLDDGTPIAVKCAKLGNTKSTEQVLNEVRILTQVNHRSLVRLLGCCVDLEQPLMVYEFIPNGTLFDHIHGVSDRPPLPWRRRLAIAHQTAEGLAYLHSSAVPPIFHRDVKSSNILIDEKLNGKVSDFGLSRLAEPGLSHVSTCAQGTLGYLDPEYYRNYQLTDKSDVYSYGVVLLELLTAGKAIDFTRGPDDVNLAVHVQRLAEEERLMDVVDPVMKEGATQLEFDTMKALGFLAMSCLEERRQNRPSMKEVMEEIEYIISILEGSIAAAPVSNRHSE